MKETKVQFSATEMELMCNSEIILTKNRVVEKVKTLLEELQHELTGIVEKEQQLSSNPVFSVHPKISKGENYLGLPYLILDYPRIFRQEECFAIRTMFWWGNFFSTTLHLSGHYKLQYAPKIGAAYNLLSTEKWSMGVSHDPWLHHFETDNYQPVALMLEKDFREECKKNHLKIAKKFSLIESHLPDRLVEGWELLVKICFR